MNIQTPTHRVRNPRAAAPSITALLIAAALCTPHVRGAEFVILLKETAKEIALRADTGAAGKAYWNDYTQFAGQLAQSGAMRDGAAIHPPTVKSGSLQLGGYFKIEAVDLEAAKAIAQQAPTLRRGGSVEVFATVPNPAMPKK